MMSSQQSDSAEGSRAGTMKNTLQEILRDSSFALLPQNDTTL